METYDSHHIWCDLHTLFFYSVGNVHTSTFKAICAMLLFRKAHSSNVWEYAPIAKTLAELSMDAITSESIKRRLRT